jgi:3-oxoadipate enol-lactonase
MTAAGTGGNHIRLLLDGDASAPVLVLAHSLGADLTMWDAQVAALSRTFRVLRFDTRGHGGSTVVPSACDIATLAGDALGLLDRLGIARAHFCGLSLGGMVGIWLAAHAPKRIDRLVLANTAAQLGPRQNWDARIAAVRAGGMAAIADTVISRWFTPEFSHREPQTIAKIRATILATPPEGYAACAAAVRDMDQRADLAAIRAPTLVIAGRHDPATPPALGHAIADAIPGASYAELDAAHLSNVEAADAFNATVLGFLSAPLRP